MDDDNYVNLCALLRLLASYPHTQDIYIGKPSLDRPIQATERVSENRVVSSMSLGWVGAGLYPVLRPHDNFLSPASCSLLVCHWWGWLLH